MFSGALLTGEAGAPGLREEEEFCWLPVIFLGREEKEVKGRYQLDLWSLIKVLVCSPFLSLLLLGKWNDELMIFLP